MIKNGIKTSEFWVNLAVGTLVGVQALPSGTNWKLIAATVAYTLGRSIVKALAPSGHIDTPTELLAAVSQLSGLDSTHGTGKLGDTTAKSAAAPSEPPLHEPGPIPPPPAA